MELSRRRFLYLCGLAAPGIYVSGGVGFLVPPAALAAQPDGVCSFCGRASHRLVGSAVEGELGTSARICSACVQRCREIVGDVDQLAAVAPTEAVFHPKLAGSPNVVEQELELILTQAAQDYGLTPYEVERVLDRARQKIDGATNVPASQVAHHFHTPTCSFCQAEQSGARRLVAGPMAAICDRCVATAASLLPMGAV